MQVNIKKKKRKKANCRTSCRLTSCEDKVARIPSSTVSDHNLLDFLSPQAGLGFLYGVICLWGVWLPVPDVALDVVPATGELGALKLNDLYNYIINIILRVLL